MSGCVKYIIKLTKISKNTVSVKKFPRSPPYIYTSGNEISPLFSSCTNKEYNIDVLYCHTFVCSSSSTAYNLESYNFFIASSSDTFYFSTIIVTKSVLI